MKIKKYYYLRTDKYDTSLSDFRNRDVVFKVENMPLITIFNGVELDIYFGEKFSLGVSAQVASRNYE